MGASEAGTRYSFWSGGKKRMLDAQYLDTPIPSDFAKGSIQSPDCGSAWGPDADRRAKLLIHLAAEGALLGAYSQCEEIAAIRDRGGMRVFDYS